MLRFSDRHIERSANRLVSFLLLSLFTLLLSLSGTALEISSPLSFSKPFLEVSINLIPALVASFLEKRRICNL